MGLPICPRYTPCILVSRIGSALPHRVKSHQTNLVDYFVYSRSHAFHGRNHTLRRKTQCIGNRTLDFYPNGESRTIGPPGRGGLVRYFGTMAVHPRKWSYFCSRWTVSGQPQAQRNHTYRNQWVPILSTGGEPARARVIAAAEDEAGRQTDTFRHSDRS